jgi:hypothetical protein
MIFECILLKMVRDTNDGRYLLFPGKFPSYPVRGKKDPATGRNAHG